ncbi:MAG TPA: TIGR04013 family B12-binding domain/radical SAM domain-containing protein [Pseudonocardiaceae bacterium]
MNIDVAVLLRYRRSSTYGHHALLGALQTYDGAMRYEVGFCRSAEKLATGIEEALTRAERVLVLWSFYSPDVPALSEELRAVRARVDDPRVVHVAGGVHATAEPLHTLHAGWDVAAVGEGETTVLRLVDVLGQGGSLHEVPGLALPDPERGLVRTGPAVREELDRFPSFAPRWNRFSPIEITRGCVYACRFCQTPFMFSARFRHRSVASVREHVREMTARGLRDVRFITPTSLSYGSPDTEPRLDAVEELLSAVKEEQKPDGRVFFGSFPSEIRPEHVSVEAMRMLRRYVANDNIIIGAQSGSESVLQSAKRGHGVQVIRDAVRIAIECGFRVNVDFIFGMPGEGEADEEASIALAAELADLGARIHAHTFMPLPGTPWRDAPAGRPSGRTLIAIEELTNQGNLYGHWRRQVEHAEVMAERAKAYPRRGGAHRRGTPPRRGR